jgi:opacity protein-like surface antigen
MRVSRLALIWIAIWMSSVAVARAQDAGRYYAAFAAGVTFGHHASGSFNGEAGARITEPLDVFFEAGHMQNVGTSELAARADVVAAFIKGSAETQQSANFFDIGVRYHGPVFAGMWRPYVGFGIGSAKVETTSTFSVNGSDITSQLPPLYGVVLGSDLSSSLNKALITIPIGVQATFRHYFLIDGSYRYGHIFAKPDDIDGDVGINAQRLQIAFGVRF